MTNVRSLIRKTLVLLILALMFCPICGVSANARDDYNAARKLFDQKKYAKAEAAYRTIIQNYPNDRELAPASLYEMGRCICAQGRLEEGIATYSQVERKFPKSAWSIAHAWNAIAHTYLERVKDYEKAEEAFRRLVARFAEPAKMIRHGQKQITETCLRQKKYDDAVIAAKIYWQVSQNDAESVKQATELLMRCLRAKDGNLGRANRFLLFQKYGPAGKDGVKGTEDDLENPLADAKLPPNDEVDLIFEEGLAALRQDLWGYKRRGYKYLYWDKPKEALREFKKRLDLVRLDDEKTLQEVFDDIAVGLKALRGTLHGVDDYYEYQMHGAAGPDGKKGTEDDLVNPLDQ